MILSPDFETRLTWTTFNGPSGGNANGIGVATRGGAIATLFEQGKGDAPSLTSAAALLSFDAPQSEPGGGASDAYLAVLLAPQ